MKNLLGKLINKKSEARESIFDVFKDYSLDEWLKVLLETKDKTSIQGCIFPRYSHDAMLGSADLESGLEEAGAFYRLGEEYVKTIDHENAKYLDFGCGLGRIFRLFMKDFSAENMLGVDPSEDYIKICREDFPDKFRFQRIHLRPPTKIPDKSIDLITAYSVFSHFSCAQATRWLQEFQRITKPGALLFLTTYGNGHIEYIDRTDNDDLSAGHKNHKKNLAMIGGKSEVYRLFELGEMLYFTTSGTFGRYDYGHAYLGDEFIKRVWGNYFEIEKIVDDYSALEQKFVVLRRK